ncbi:MAG: hypothetical protein ABI314_04555 [Gemmatimonadaceae bacterium]
MTTSFAFTSTQTAAARCAAVMEEEVVSAAILLQNQVCELRELIGGPISIILHEEQHFVRHAAAMPVAG